MLSSYMNLNWMIGAKDRAESQNPTTPTDESVALKE